MNLLGKYGGELGLCSVYMSWSYYQYVVRWYICDTVRWELSFLDDTEGKTLLWQWRWSWKPAAEAEPNVTELPALCLCCMLITVGLCWAEAKVQHAAFLTEVCRDSPQLTVWRQLDIRYTLRMTQSCSTRSGMFVSVISTSFFFPLVDFFVPELQLLSQVMLEEDVWGARWICLVQLTAVYVNKGKKK